MTAAARIIRRPAAPITPPVAYPPLFHATRQLWARLSAARSAQGLIAVTLDQVMTWIDGTSAEARFCLATLEAMGAIEGLSAPATLLEVHVYRVLVPCV